MESTLHHLCTQCAFVITALLLPEHPQNTMHQHPVRLASICTALHWWTSEKGGLQRSHILQESQGSLTDWSLYMC